MQVSFPTEPETLPSINAMFPDEECTVTMTRHCFEVIHAAMQYINPGQIPVMSMEQPLFAKMKQLQWSMDTMYGEDKCVLLFGGHHIELAFYKLVRNPCVHGLN